MSRPVNDITSYTCKVSDGEEKVHPGRQDTFGSRVIRKTSYGPVDGTGGSSGKRKTRERRECSTLRHCEVP